MIKIEFKCKKNCGKCCKELICFVNLDDFHRWIDEDRMDIISCLTWFHLEKARPPLKLFIPRKRDLKNHNYLRGFYKKEWNNNTECIFFNGRECIIKHTKPSACREFPKGKLDFKCPGIIEIEEEDKEGEKRMGNERFKQEIKIFQNRELISSAIKKSKERVWDKEMLKLFYRPKIIKGDIKKTGGKEK